jgi:hypothetical protein
MSALFRKVKNTSRLFGKVLQDPNLFRKISNTARKTDNSMARIGNFLVDTANQFGLSPVASGIKNVVNGTHIIRNNLEKAVRAPIGQVQNNVYDE